MTTISYKDINLDDLILSSPEKIGDCYMCNLYNDDDLLYIQTPYCKINEIVEENGEKFIDVEIDNKGFIDFLLEIKFFILLFVCFCLGVSICLWQ